MRPKPRQVSQAPSGLLNENRFGVGSRYGEAAARRTRARSRSARARPPSSGSTTAARPRAVRGAPARATRPGARASVGAQRRGGPDHDERRAPPGRRLRALVELDGRRRAPSTRMKPARERARRATSAHGSAGRQRHGERDQRARARRARASSRVGDALRRRRARPARPQLPAVRHADLREEQLQVVVQLGHRADGRARRLDRAALVDRDRRQDAVDALDLRLLHAVEELARVGGEALDVAALALGVEDVERERSTCPSPTRR